MTSCQDGNFWHSNIFIIFLRRPKTRRNIFFKADLRQYRVQENEDVVNHSQIFIYFVHDIFIILAFHISIWISKFELINIWTLIFKHRASPFFVNIKIFNNNFVTQNIHLELLLFRNNSFNKFKIFNIRGRLIEFIIIRTHSRKKTFV